MVSMVNKNFTGEKWKIEAHRATMKNERLKLKNEKSMKKKVKTKAKPVKK